MPRNKSVQNLCVNTILLFSFLVLAGHITINFWERYTVQNQLINMKRNLYSLKETISRIEKTYDDLHVEIIDLSKKLDTKQSKTSLEYNYCNKEMQEAGLRNLVNSKAAKLPKNAVTITRFPFQSIDSIEIFPEKPSYNSDDKITA